MWTFTAHENWNEIYSEDSINKWQSLLNISPTAHVFFTPELVKIWTETYRPIREIFPVFIQGKEGGNEVFFPLVVWKKNWKNIYQKVIVPVGYSDYDYHDPIFKFLPEDIASFWEELNAFLLKNYKVDAVEILGIRQLEDLPGWTIDDTCPYLDLRDIHNTDELMNTFPHTLRKDIRRKIRHLEEFGKLEMKEYFTWEETEEHFHEFMKIHTEKWPNSYKAPHFHENLLKKGLPSGIVHFTTLNLDNKPIAWNLGFEYKGTFHYYMATSNQSLSKYSPSKMHLFYLVERAVQLKFHTYDHLKGEENYKSGWSSGSRYVYKKYTLSGSPISYFKQPLLELKKALVK